MRLDDAAAVLSYADFFAICDDEQKRLLAFSSERQIFAPDEVVYQAGDEPQGAYVLISGTLKISPEARGKPTAVSNRGSVISAIALVLAKPRPLTVSAVVECETLFVPRAAFMKLCQQSPDLAVRAAEQIEQDLRAYLNALEPIRSRMKQ